MANNRTLTTAEEEQRVARAVMVWINSYSNLPTEITRVDYEQLPADKVGMAVSAIQGAYIVKKYITGGHTGEYQFKIIYRIKPSTSNDARLKADELLNAIGEWATSNYPTLGTGIRVMKLEPTTRSSMFAVYENGDEDHQILMKLNYEVI